jgi:predicted phosphoribosyltransferase
MLRKLPRDIPRNVTVAVAVAAPVVVTALVSGSDAVAVLDAVNERASCGRGDRDWDETTTGERRRATSTNEPCPETPVR